MTKHKYYRITANSMTSYEYYIKVPDTITPDDIWEQRGDNVLDGANFKAMDNGWGGYGDWEYDDIHEVDDLKLANYAMKLWKKNLYR